MMTRRKLLQGAIAAGVWHMLGKTGRAGQASSAKDIENLQNNWRALLAKDFKAPAPSDPLKLSNDEWRKRLDAAQFQILREEGTERRTRRDDLSTIVHCEGEATRRGGDWK